MDADDVIVVDDDNDQRVGDSESRNAKEGTNSETRISFEDSDGDGYDESSKGMYEEDIEGVLNEFLNEEDTYSGEDEEYGEGQESVSQKRSNIFGRLDRSKGTKPIDQNVEPTGKDVDDVIVNSHLQEIDDIKNQIQELQDILHVKGAGSEKVKSQDIGDDDENETMESRGKTSSNNIQLKRNPVVKTDAKKRLVRRVESNEMQKRGWNKMPLLSERFQPSLVTSSREKLDKKRKLKRNEMTEDDTGGAPLLSHLLQKKKTFESAKMKIEKKLKPINEDSVSEETIDAKLQEIENIPPSVTSSLRKILQMTAHTPEEKYRVLDARDKLYKIMRDRDQSGKTGALVGTCPDMCPEKERLQREFQCQVSIFEMVNYPKNTNLNHNYAVKQYCRSSADQEEPLPHELRPVNVLTMTMSYLLHNVADHCELSDENLGDWYMFMWDRTRALRKELTQQGACNLDTVKLVEQCARFHIHSAERLVDQDSSIYDDKINTENLTKCLQTLKYMYKDLAKEDVHCPNESEFVCYSLLLNLNNASVFTELSDMSQRLMSSEPVRFALDIMTAWETKNYVRFFNLVNRTTYLNCCILRRYFNEMRLYATKTMIRSYCTKNYSPQIPIYRFVDNLSFEGINDCCNFLSHCNFDLNKSDDAIHVNFNRSAFRNPDTPFPSGRAFVIIGAKKRRPFSVVMAGGELPARTYEDHAPQNSFAPNGELKLDSLLCRDLMDFANAPPAPAPVQPVKSKLFDARVESKSSKEPGFPDIFGKSQRFGQEGKDPDSGEKKSEDKPVFTKTVDKPSIFGGVTPFGQSTGNFNIFGSSAKTTETKPSIFGSKEENPFGGSKSIFGTQSTNLFGSSSPFFKKRDAEEQKFSVFQPGAESVADGGFRFKVKTPPAVEEDEKSREEESEKRRREMEKLEEERLQREEELRRQKEEEEEQKEEERLRNILIEAVKKSKEEAEKRERERREAEEEEKRNRERKEREEKKRLEELERIRKEELRIQEELARKEEEKRKYDADVKYNIEMKMASLKKKYMGWKVREFFCKWRFRTWVTIEDRKMKEYFKEVHVRYPPVCTEEHLNGNPYGLIIPNALILGKCQSRHVEAFKPKVETNRFNLEDLSPVDVRDIAAKTLEIRAKRLFNKVDPFPWKVLFSVPDNSECGSWKAIETFVEMNFVDNYNWRFGRQSGPLYYREGCHGTFRYRISVRRVRGTDLHEGADVNANAATGSNALIFVMSEDCDVNVARERLRKVLTSRSPLPKIPVIVFLLGEKHTPEDVESTLGLKTWLGTHTSEHRVVTSNGYSKDELISQLVRCVTLAADCSSPVTLLRVHKLTDFCSSAWFESVWRRIETSLSNYRVILKDPHFLIECYNSSADELAKIFLEPEDEKYTTIGEEFGVERLARPSKTSEYRTRLRESIERMKLPHWPREIPKSSHQLKYRIHQYCKKVTEEKRKMKELKWLLYRIIRRSLLWKGLDIYCDEDIDCILFSFPWIQFFQEISRFIVQELIRRIKSEGSDLCVAYRVDKIEQFSYESSLISKFIGDSKRKKSTSKFEEMETSPRVEHDSVIFAYTAALERERNKRKRDEMIEENLEELFEFAESKRQMLEEEEDNDEEEEEEDELKEKTKIDVKGLKSNFQSLSDRLDEMKRRMEENARLLKELEGT